MFWHLRSVQRQCEALMDNICPGYRVNDWIVHYWHTLVCTCTDIDRNTRIRKLCTRFVEISKVFKIRQKFKSLMERLCFVNLLETANFSRFQTNFVQSGGIL